MFAWHIISLLAQSYRNISRLDILFNTLLIHSHVTINSGVLRCNGSGFDVISNTHAEVEMLPDVAVSLLQRPSKRQEEAAITAEPW